jgi:Tachylectin
MPVTVGPWDSVEYGTARGLIASAGPIGMAFKFVEFIYTFGKTNPIEYAIQRLGQEIDALRAELEQLQNRVNTLAVDQARNENDAVVEVLTEQVIELSTTAFQLMTQPGNREAAAVAAYEAGARADRFITLPKRWHWRDIRTVTPRNEARQPIGPPVEEAMPAEFKAEVAFPVYSMALAVWLAAMSTHAAGDTALLRAIYGTALERHAAFCGVTFGWRDDGTGATTLQEQIRSRITCQPIAVRTYADAQGVCAFTVQCSDELARTRKVVREFSLQVGTPGVQTLCTVRPEVVLQDERAVEDADPTLQAVMLWEEMLRAMASMGHLPADPVIGVFPQWSAALTGLYGVDAAQDLRYWTQALPGNGAWEHGIRIGTGWGFIASVHAGVNTVLGLRPDGEWLWYRHTGAGTTPPTEAWQPGWREVGKWSTWGQATADMTYFGAGYGVVYGLVGWVTGGDATPGDLLWAQLPGYLTGAAGFAPVRKVGTGWDAFKTVACMGHGVIYGIYPDGRLRWHKHVDYKTGGTNWLAHDIASDFDWSVFERVVASEGGALHGIYPNGRMLTFRHLDWDNGGPRLEGPIEAGADWRAQRSLFAAMPGYVPF